MINPVALRTAVRRGAPLNKRRRKMEERRLTATRASGEARGACASDSTTRCTPCEKLSCHGRFALIIHCTGPIYLVYSLVFPHPKVGTFTQIFIYSTKCSSAKVVIFTWICTFMRHFLPVKVKNGHFHVIMHFYAIFFTYVDLSEEGRSGTFT